jgi:predicted nucleic acid-binding Zn ribbon protein
MAKKKPTQTECPECGTELAEGAVLCVECGYHLEEERFLTTRKKRFRRTWQLGLSLVPQVIVAGLMLVGCVVATVMLGPIWSLLFLAAIVIQFVISLTGKRVVIQRTPKGNLELTVNGWLMFFPVVFARINLKHYDTAYTYYEGDGDYEFYTLKIQGDDVPAYTVYSGGSQDLMKEFADVMQYEGKMTIRRGRD